MDNISVGECFRDTYYDDKPEWSHRTIKVIEVLPNGVVVTPNRQRFGPH